LFAVEALIARKQAREKMEQSAARRKWLVALPSAAPVFSNGQATGATLGLVGAF
jgi:hypothetical protein